MNGFGFIDSKSVEDQSALLAHRLFPEFSQQAIADADDYLQKTRGDLHRLMSDLHAGRIDKDEFADLVRDNRALAEMDALKQAGLDQPSIDTFISGVTEFVINAAFAALKI